MTTAEFIEKDQQWQEESTTYWFEVDGLDNPEGFDYNGIYGVVEGRNAGVVHEDSDPVLNDWIRDQVKRHCIITDEMRDQ